MFFGPIEAEMDDSFFRVAVFFEPLAEWFSFEDAGAEVDPRVRYHLLLVGKIPKVEALVEYDEFAAW